MLFIMAALKEDAEVFTISPVGFSVIKHLQLPQSE